jgi:hypothetical protein
VAFPEIFLLNLLLALHGEKASERNRRTETSKAVCQLLKALQVTKEFWICMAGD